VSTRAPRDGYENLAARPPDPDDDERTSRRPPAWRPLFEGGPEQARRWQEAMVATPRRRGEPTSDWLERVAAAAERRKTPAQVPLGDRELPAGDRAREPGSDDE